MSSSLKPTPRKWKAIRTPGGLFMVTGPHGSGVTPHTICAVNGPNAEPDAVQIAAGPDVMDTIRRGDFQAASAIVAALDAGAAP